MNETYLQYMTSSQRIVNKTKELENKGGFIEVLIENKTNKQSLTDILSHSVSSETLREWKEKTESSSLFLGGLGLVFEPLELLAFISVLMNKEFTEAEKKAKEYEVQQNEEHERKLKEAMEYIKIAEVVDEMKSKLQESYDKFNRDRSPDHFENTQNNENIQGGSGIRDYPEIGNRRTV